MTIKKGILFFILLFTSFVSYCQCSMCKAVAENNDDLGINKGIIYIMVVPYIIMAVVAVIWYRSHKKSKKE